jgi:hypothetical protein
MGAIQSGNPLEQNTIAATDRGQPRLCRSRWRKKERKKENIYIYIKRERERERERERHTHTHTDCALVRQAIVLRYSSVAALKRRNCTMVSPSSLMSCANQRGVRIAHGDKMQVARRAVTASHKTDSFSPTYHASEQANRSEPLESRQWTECESEPDLPAGTGPGAFPRRPPQTLVRPTRDHCLPHSVSGNEWPPRSRASCPLAKSNPDYTS